MRVGDGIMHQLRENVTDPRGRLEDVVANWPTPTTRDWKDTGNLENVPENGLLGRVAANWTTPSASDGERDGTITDAMSGTILSQQVNSLWSTRRASDGEKGSPNQSFGAGGIPLAAQTTQWTTPTVNGNSNRKGSSATSQDGLRTQAVDRFSLLAQPIASPGRASRQPILTAFRRYRATTDSSLRAEQRALIRLAIKAERRGERRAHTRPSFRRSLNDIFVGWLMGWPRGWTRFACSATALSAWKARMRCALLALGLPHPAQPAQSDLFQ